MNKEKITLDGKEVTVDKLEEMKKNPEVKLDKVAENVYKSKKRLYG